MIITTMVVVTREAHMRVGIGGMGMAIGGTTTTTTVIGDIGTTPIRIRAIHTTTGTRTTTKPRRAQFIRSATWYRNILFFIQRTARRSWKEAKSLFQTP